MLKVCHALFFSWGIFYFGLVHLSVNGKMDPAPNRSEFKTNLGQSSGVKLGVSLRKWVLASELEKSTDNARDLI